MNHESYMKRCFDLALRGGKYTKSNPNVGSVILYKDTIIGEGFHQYFGGPHAEVNAINAVSDKSKLKDATLYVSLEPCCTLGKTPPCTNAILSHGIPKVVVSAQDPNPKVAGNGIETLRKSGVEVIENICHEDGLSIIKPFIANLSRRPYIILKQAVSKDQYIGSKKEQLWLTDQPSNIITHRWRSEVDAILIGKKTALIDNPSLTTRHWFGEDPKIVLLDPKLEVLDNAKIFDKKENVIVVNETINDTSNGIMYLKYPKNDLEGILHGLFNVGINRLLVEGGASIINSFVVAGLWDEYRHIQTNKILKNTQNVEDMVSAIQIKGTVTKTYSLFEDTFIHMVPNL